MSKFKNAYTGDHIIVQLYSHRRDLLLSKESMYRYLEEVTEVAKMTPLTGPAVFSIPFANELSNYTNEIERELEKLGTELKTVNKMRKRINARKFQDSGCTGTIVWSESHCASHSWPEKDFITIDLYSCKDFNVEEVINFTRKYWYSGRLVYRLIHRYTDYNIVEDDVILYGME